MKFEMTEAQLAVLMDAGKPTAYPVANGSIGRSPQENANSAWRSLGDVMGFKWDTVQPYPGNGPRVFTAEPTTKEPTH